jgi:hypothetical protein
LEFDFTFVQNFSQTSWINIFSTKINVHNMIYKLEYYSKIKKNLRCWLLVRCQIVSEHTSSIFFDDT